VELYEGQTVNQ